MIFPPSSYTSRCQPMDQGVTEKKNKNTVVEFFSYWRYWRGGDMFTNLKKKPPCKRCLLDSASLGGNWAKCSGTIVEKVSWRSRKINWRYTGREKSGRKLRKPCSLIKIVPGCESVNKDTQECVNQDEAQPNDIDTADLKSCKRRPFRK